MKCYITGTKFKFRFNILTVIDAVSCQVQQTITRTKIIERDFRNMTRSEI